jgi:hypothetical protein
MYGTTMIASLKGDRAAMERELSAWVAVRGPEVPGFLDARLLFADDGTTVVNTVRFASREDYERLADDPRQDEWYTERIRPLIEGEARWIDGDWFEPQPG